MPLFYRFLAYSVAGSITLMPLLVLPAMIGVLAETSALDEVQAGWAASAGFLGGALTSLVLAFRMHHVDLRRVAMAGFGLALAGDFISGLMAGSPTLFMACRFLTGIGTGAAYTVFIAAFARERHAERGYGLLITIEFIISGIGLYLLPVLSDYVTTFGLFSAFAVLDAVGLALCLTLPHKAPKNLENAIARDELSVLLARATLLGVLGFAVFEAGFMAQFTYVERYGVSIALTGQQIGMAMLVGSLMGIPGAFAIVLTGSRFGYVLPIAVGVSSGVAGLLLMIATTAYTPFMLAFCLLGFGWAFCLPYIQGLLATLDRAGSALAAGAALSTLGGAAGPALAASLLGDGNYHRVFYAAMVALLISVVAFALAVRKERAA